MTAGAIDRILGLAEAAAALACRFPPSEAGAIVYPAASHAIPVDDALVSVPDAICDGQISVPLG